MASRLTIALLIRQELKKVQQIADNVPAEYKCRVRTPGHCPNCNVAIVRVLLQEERFYIYNNLTGDYCLKIIGVTDSMLREAEQLLLEDNINSHRFGLVNEYFEL